MAGVPVQQLHKGSMPRLYSRQRLLLGLLDGIGGDAGNTDFQKLLFLYCKELSSHQATKTPQGLYDFVPYRYGAFSFTSYADRRRFVDWGLLVDNDQKWVLTENGSNIAGNATSSAIRSFSYRYRSVRGDALVADTYRRYPYYAIRSEIADQVLQDDQPTLDRIESTRPKATPSRLFTIGYEGRTLESYLNLLIREGTTLLCDVRRNAISRKYGFSKTTLETGLLRSRKFATNIFPSLESISDDAEVSRRKRISKICSRSTYRSPFRIRAMRCKELRVGCGPTNR